MGYFSTGTANTHTMTVTSTEEKELNHRLVDYEKRGYVLLGRGKYDPRSGHFNRVTYWAKIIRTDEG